MRYTVLDVKRACTRVLRAAFPELPVYDNDTVDGYTRPSFFVEVLSIGQHRESRRLCKASFSYLITYFEVTHDEAECLRKYEVISAAFGSTVRVFEGSRLRITVKDIELNWIGTNMNDNKNMMQVSISFYESIGLNGIEDDSDLMQSIVTEYTEEEG